jgi:hypothetical protein
MGILRLSWSKLSDGGWWRLVLLGVLAPSFWAWSAFIAFGAGIVGAGMSCEDRGCSYDAVDWMKPWTLEMHDVVPVVSYLGLAGFALATASVAAVIGRSSVTAGATFAAAVWLLSYPFFVGLTNEGQRHLWFGPVLGAAAVVASRRTQ